MKNISLCKFYKEEINVRLTTEIVFYLPKNDFNLFFISFPFPVPVVLLRGCWLDGSNKCLKNGAAEVCTCSRDLCNSATRTWDRLATTSVVLSVMVAVLL